MTTHNQTHTSTLHHRTNHNQTRQHTPALLASLLASKNHSDIRHDRHALKHNREAHEEADGAPHGAEVAVFAMTIFVLGEVGAETGQGGAAFVKTVGVADMVTGGLWT